MSAWAPAAILTSCLPRATTAFLLPCCAGLSKHLESAKTLMIGTPDYMAPELLGHKGGTATYDARCVDVWALGALRAVPAGALCAHA